MKLLSPVLLKLADLYAESAAGRHGGGKLDFQPAIENLLRAAGCAEGEARELAERDLRSAHDAGVVSLVPIHPRDAHHFAKVRLAPESEEAFFAYIGLTSPTARRTEWAALFTEAERWPVPERFAEAWRAFCLRRAEAALSWRGMKPFDRADLASGRDLIALLVCECAARRCLTVENATPFRSLAALRSGELLIHTSYPNDATLGMLRRLKMLQSPPAFWHFGDTDPSGFHILADLRERSGIPFRSFQMNFRQSAGAVRRACPHPRPRGKDAE